MKDYKIDFATNTVTVSKAFAEKASRIDTNEYKILTKVKKDFPGIEVTHKTRSRSKSKNANKGLTYRNMETYINAFDNRGELLEAFYLIQQLSAVQKSRYQYVRSWFVAQFPDYEKIPTLHIIDNVYPLNARLVEDAVSEARQVA